MDKGGPSAMSLYNSAGNESMPADTGMGMGRQLYDAELAAKSRYAEPSMGPEQTVMLGTATRGTAKHDIPVDTNLMGPLPVKYTVPSAMKERMQARQAIRKEAGVGLQTNMLRTDPISEEEVDYLQSMQDQAELADFDRYVNSLIDPRKPGNLKWLMEIYPDFVNRRIKQVHTDYEYALRGQMIDSWGINTFDDLHFKYLQDQGKITGPYLTSNARPGEDYKAGILAPAAFASGKLRCVRLPFASARFGQSAADGAQWRMSDEGQPMVSGRSMDDMAKAMYATSLGAMPETRGPNEAYPQPDRAFT